MRLSLIFAFSVILSCAFISCNTSNGDSATMLRVRNLTGYEIVNAEVNLFFDGVHLKMDYQNLADGDVSKYQEIPSDSLDEAGDYCTYTNLETKEQEFELTMAILCTGLNSERAVLLKRGNYSLILETEPVEFLDLSLLTHNQNANNEDVLINIKNNSEQDFLEVRAIFPASATTEQTEVNYGSVKSGESSEFVSVDLAYRYTTMIVVTEADTLHWEPIDYVGEIELEPGRYSYELDIWVGPADVSRIIRE